MEWVKARIGVAEHTWNTRPAIRLATGYVLILLVLSLIFSLVLYHLAAEQLFRGLSHQFRQFNAAPPGGSFDPDNLPSAVQANIDSARHGLILNLVYFNLFIIAIGAVASYWLAKRTLRPIEAALDAQTRFAADASHELRTPLAVMQTEIEIARGDPKLTRDEALELLDSNLEEVKKLHRLSDGLLRLARSEVKPLPLVPLALEAVADEAVGRVAAAAKAKNVSLRLDTQPVSANGDHESLVELVAILLDNAIKYSPRGQSVTITNGQQGHTCWLAVTDHGRGISAADLPHIFDRFYRADKSRTGADVAGHGLGLSLAKQIADLHGAEIVATSRAGHGSTFTLKLHQP